MLMETNLPPNWNLYPAVDVLLPRKLDVFCSSVELLSTNLYAGHLSQMKQPEFINWTKLLNHSIEWNEDGKQTNHLKTKLLQGL